MASTKFIATLSEEMQENIKNVLFLTIDEIGTETQVADCIENIMNGRLSDVPTEEPDYYIPQEYVEYWSKGYFIHKGIDIDMGECATVACRYSSREMTEKVIWTAFEQLEADESLDCVENFLYFLWAE